MKWYREHVFRAKVLALEGSDTFCRDAKGDGRTWWLVKDPGVGWYLYAWHLDNNEADPTDLHWPTLREAVTACEMLFRLMYGNVLEDE